MHMHIINLLLFFVKISENKERAINPQNAIMTGLRAEKPLQCRNLAIDRYDLFYLIIYSVFELLMFYKGGAGKDFFISQTCHVRL